MNAILGCVAFDERPVCVESFRKAFAILQPKIACSSGERFVTACAFGHHQAGLAANVPIDARPVFDGRFIVVADAILDDRSSLARDLGVRPEMHSDPALILGAWRRWGERCLPLLYGDFAVLVYDVGSQSIHLFRDHIGARPLYWWRAGPNIVVTSALRALQAFPDIELCINKGRVAQYLTDPLIVCSDTFIDKAFEVGPGEVVRLTNDGTQRSRWWDPMQLPDVRFSRSEHYFESFRDRFEQAVSHRLSVDSPVGLHISGGIDSTAVTIEAAKLARRHGRMLRRAYAWAPAVSATWPDQGIGDERRVIRDVCAANGISACFGGASGETFRALIAREMEFEGTADLMDELAVLERAAADGTRVLLSGWGGDEGFSAHGHGYVAWLLRSGRPGQALLVARTAARGLRNPSRMLRFLWMAGVVPMLPNSLYWIFCPFEEIYSGGCFLHQDVRKRYPQVSGRRKIRLSSDPIVFLRQLILNGHIGERMATWSAWGASKGVTYRYPLTDRRLLELILGMPPDILFRGGRPRSLAHDALADRLPKGLKKYDLVNEALRHSCRRECWAILERELADGYFYADCPWLDMPKLRAEIQKGPSGDLRGDVIRFAKITAAMRVWHVWERANYRRPADASAFVNTE